MTPRESAESAEAEWNAARAALRAGDRAGAEPRLRALVALADAPARLRDQAEFQLAEIELARGDTARAGARLDALSRSRDPALAADAVFLQARAKHSPRERAEAYARYLAGAPPSPYREQAMVERGSALADAGDIAGARAIVTALRGQATLPEVVHSALEGLERRVATP